MICRYAYCSTSLEKGLSRRVVPAAVATTQAKPHAQQQLAREREVGRAAMGQRRRPHSFGEVQQGHPQPPCRWLGILCTAVQQQSRVRACDLIPAYHTGGAALPSCRPPISKRHPNSVVCSRSRVRLYASALRSRPGPVQQHASRQPSSKGDDCFFIFFKRLVVAGLVFRFHRMLWYDSFFCW